MAQSSIHDLGSVGCAQGPIAVLGGQDQIGEGIAKSRDELIGDDLQNDYHSPARMTKMPEETVLIRYSE